MEIIGKTMMEEEKKNKRLMKIIIIVIVLLAIILLALFGAIAYLSSTKLKFVVNGQATKVPDGMFIIEEDGNVYISIKQFAELVGYETFNGEYKLISEEDPTKCYIRSQNEIASFTLELDKIYKTKPGVTNNFEYYSISKPVKNVNGILYAPMDAMVLATNSQITYTKENNQITVFTLPYLVTYYNSKLQTEGKYLGLSENFDNQKAILYNMFVVQKEDGTMGVISGTGEDIIGTKYIDINFLENTKEFFVTTEEKTVGIILPTGKFKIVPSYQELKLMDKESKLYLAKKNDKYGVIDDNGKIIIYLEYDKIGIEPSDFKSDDITNEYILLDTCIPVKKSDKWGLYGKNGNMILPVEYEGLGFEGTTKDKGTNKVLIIPDYDAIVVKKDKMYGLVDTKGKELIPCILEEIYSITEAGQNNYYITYQGNKINLQDLVPRESSNNTQQNSNTNTTNTTNTTNITSTNDNSAINAGSNTVGQNHVDNTTQTSTNQVNITANQV